MVDLYLRNKFHFSDMHRNMNAEFAQDPLRSYLSEK